MIRLTWSFPYTGSTARRTRLFFSARSASVSRERICDPEKFVTEISIPIENK